MNPGAGHRPPAALPEPGGIRRAVALILAALSGLVLARLLLAPPGLVLLILLDLLPLAAFALVLHAPDRHGGLLDAALLLTCAVAVLPLVIRVAEAPGPVAVSVRAGLDASLLPVPLLAGRVAVLARAERFRRFWAGEGPACPPHGLAGAMMTGLFLTLLAYLAMGFLPHHGGGSAGALILAALRSATLIHAAILLLFFTLLAALAEAAFRLRAERQCLARLVAHIERTGILDHGEAADAELAASPALARFKLGAMRGGHPALPVGRAEARLAYELAARRQLRALLALLPLLGFLGTVVGLATAIADLPAGMEAGAMADLSGSLAGLAVKFETTLLGLSGSMIAGLGLAALERREAEASAEILLALDGLRRAGWQP